MPRITDVVKILIIINVIMYAGSRFLMPDTYMLLALWPPGYSDFFQPYQIVSHMFMHADLMHIAFNMFGLFMFGPPLESLWGPKKFLFFYLVCGFGALAIHMLTTYLGLSSLGPVLGASGALYGVLAGYGMNFPNSKLALIFFPVPVAAKYFIPGLLALDFIGGFTGFSIFGKSIAHFAHIGGALFGFLMVLYWQKFGSRL